MYEKYIINANDTLDSIAKRFEVPISSLLKENNIKYGDNLRQGTQIEIPIKGESYFTYYTVNQGDNLYQIAKRYNINPTLLATLNGLNIQDYIYPNQQLVIPKSGYSFYITKEGDTLSTVKDKFNAPLTELLKTNETIYLLPSQLMVYKTN